MEKHKYSPKSLIFPAVITILIVLGIILRLIIYRNSGYNVNGDECHSIYGSMSSIKDLFFRFDEGANFLPLYRCLLSLFINIYGVNWPLLKLPSVISSIGSIFVFYQILKNVFKNKLLIAGALSLFCVNYTIILYTVKIKPYASDVLIVLLIIYLTILLYKKANLQDLSYGKTIIYAVFASICCFFSVPAIIYVQFSYFGILIKNLDEKRWGNLSKLLIFEFIVGNSVVFEYFTYIRQMKEDGNLKQQWLNDGFFFAPDSFDALNALVHSLFFEIQPFDFLINNRLPDIVLFIFAGLFIVGSVKLLTTGKKENIFYFYLLTCPVSFFAGLSFFYLYPFCNRMIIFLIPVITILIVNAFNFEKIKIFSGIMFICLLASMFFYIWQINELYPLITNKEANIELRKGIEFLEKRKGEDEIILSNEKLCVFCLNNKNALITEYDNFLENEEITYFDRRNGKTSRSSVSGITNGFNKIYFVYDDNDTELIWNKKLLEKLKSLNWKETKTDYGLVIFSEMEKEK